MDTWNTSPEDLLSAMRDRRLGRAFVISDPEAGELLISDELIAPIRAAILADRRDYRGHAAVFFEIGRESGHLLSAFIHKTCRGQAAGGVRFWRYPTVEGLVRDGLRLSRGMGHKNALAGLWWGGGKGVIARRDTVDHRDPELRAAIYRDYGRMMSGLCGCYVTAEDAGTTADDMAWIHSTTRHTTCIPPALGGSGNPSVLTARGVIAAMEAALEWRGLGDLRGKTVATQGLGNVARFMIEGLRERGVARVLGVDVDADAVAAARTRFGTDLLEARQVDLGDMSVLAAECDILAPNAIGAILDPRTIPAIQASVVCGGANNQLADPERDAAALARRDVLYVPDFLANRMGIVHCSNEQYGCFPGDPAIEDHLDRRSAAGIHQRCLEVFERGEASGQPPAIEAVALADELAEELHPIWEDRGSLIIAALRCGGWAEAEPLAP